MKEINDTITPEKVKHYLDLTSTARQKATAIHKPESEQGKMLSYYLRWLMIMLVMHNTSWRLVIIFALLER